MRDFFTKNEKFKVFIFFTILTVILTWPVLINFLSSVASDGPDTTQVIGSAGIQANELQDLGIFRGTFDLIKHSSFNILTVYAYFQLIFGRVFGYNLLFYLSFILSGFGAYLLADYFVKNKKAAILAGIIFAFSPFHMHNALGTNVGTMHQEWLPFFALYLFKFFEKFQFKYFLSVALFLFLIGFTEHQLLAFTAIFILFFIIYKLITEPRKFLDRKFWICLLIAAAFFSIVFFFIFRNLITIATSDNNFLDAGMRSVVKYSNDSLSIFVTPFLHPFWPKAFAKLREQFERKSSSTFSVFAGYSVLLLSSLGIIFWKYMKNRKRAVKSIFFWLIVALGFYVLSWGPYLHFKGMLEPRVRMPYYLIYQYLPFYKNIRTVGRMFVYSMLAFSLLAVWGMSFIEFKILKLRFNKKGTRSEEMAGGEEPDPVDQNKIRSLILYSFVGLIIILEFLAIPLKMNSLLHSSFYEKIGQDKENYSVLEIPGSTSYDFASRDLVWKSIHGKKTVNGYDFARVNDQGYAFQEETPIIKTLLYDIPKGDGNSKDNGNDILSSSYYDVSNEILNYYNIRYIIVDHQSLRGDPAKGDLDRYYTVKAFIRDVIVCSEDYEDKYLYACKVAPGKHPNELFFSMDYSNQHWVGKSDGKNGLKRWAESGAGLKLVNISSAPQSRKISFNAKLFKPLNLKVLLNGKVVYDKYITEIFSNLKISTNEIGDIKPGENSVVFEVRGADGAEIHSDKKSEAVMIGNIDVN